MLPKEINPKTIIKIISEVMYESKASEQVVFSISKSQLKSTEGIYIEKPQYIRYLRIQVADRILMSLGNRKSEPMYTLPIWKTNVRRSKGFLCKANLAGKPQENLHGSMQNI